MIKHTVPFRQLGLAGEIKDIMNQDIPSNGIRSARSIRVEDQALATYSNAHEFLSDVVGETFLFHHPFWINGTDGYIVVSLVDGTPDTIKVEHIDLDGTATDVSPASTLDISAGIWYAVQIGRWLILTNDGGVDKPQLITDQLDPAVDLPGWPDGYYASVIEVYKNFLVAVGITKGSPLTASGDEDRMVKWSHPFADGDTTTDWDYTSSTNLAGERVLAEPGRGLVGARPVNDSLMLYFDRKTWRMDLIGGQFVMDTQQVFTDDGMIGPHASINTHDGTIVFGYRDVYRHNGFNKTSISDGKNTRWVYDSLDLTFSPVGAYYPKRNEAMFVVRSNTSGEGNIILLYNVMHGSWTQVEAEQNGDGLLTHICSGMRPNTGSVLYTDWTTEEFDDFDETTWAGLADSDETVTILGLSKQNGVLWDLDYNGVSDIVTLFRKNALVEHLGLDFDGMKNDRGKTISVGNKIVYLSRIFPQIKGSGVVKCTVGTRATVDGSIDWQPADTIDLDDDADYAWDIRCAGRYLAYRIEPNDPDDPADFVISGMDWEISVAGTR